VNRFLFQEEGKSAIRLWSQTARSCDPYVPGEQPRAKNIIKLNTNENPYPPSPRVLKALAAAVNGDLRLYPSPQAEELRIAIAEFYGMKPDQVFVGNGSDELLAFSFLAFFNPGETVLFPDITYSFYPVYAKLFHIDYEEVPLFDDFSMPVEKFFGAEGGVIFPNPNAPTGVYTPLEDVERILRNNPDKPVIIDEAYIDFGGETAAKLIDRYDQLLVIQTFSKSRSIAGLRVGFALGNERLIEGLNRIKNSFNSYTVDRLALIGAKAAIEDVDYFTSTCRKIIRTRERVAAELKAIGFQVTDSKANFLFVKHPRIPGRKLYEHLKERSIYVRHFDRPRIKDYIRVTIGTDEDMDAFLNGVSPPLLS